MTNMDTKEKHIPHNHLSSDEIDLSQLLRILRQYKYWIIITTVLIFLIGISYAILSIPTYRSDALLQLEEKNNPLSILEDLPFNTGVGVSTRSEIDIITSRRILGAVVDELKLQINIQPESDVVDSFVSRIEKRAANQSWRAGGFVEDSGAIEIQSFVMPPGHEAASYIIETRADGTYYLFDEFGAHVLAGRAGMDVKNNNVELFVSQLTIPAGNRFMLQVVSRSDAIEILRSRLKVSSDPRKSDSMLRLNLEHYNPQAASLILNAVIKHYVQYNIATNAAVTEKTLEFIEGQLKVFSTDLAFNNELYLMLLTKAHELRVMKAGEIGNVRVVDAAVVPSVPVAPRKGIIVGLSLILGLFAGVMAAFIRSVMDRSLYDPHQIESSLNIPVYTTIPLSQEQIKLNKLGWMIGNNGNISQGLLYNKAPDDPAMEAIRYLREMIEHGDLHSNHKVIAITGPSPNVGKTFLSTNLACLLSELGQKVLLIDADLRRGVVHEYFALEKECGLADYLTDSVTIESIVKYSGLGQMDIITRGGSPDNPSVLMSSSRLQMLLDECRQNYDVVLIDTPPALAVTDAAIISRHVEQLLLVIKAGLTTMDEVAVCWQRLTQSGKRPSGLVMSGYDPSKLGYSKYQQYGYY